MAKLVVVEKAAPPPPKKYLLEMNEQEARLVQTLVGSLVGDNARDSYKSARLAAELYSSLREIGKAPNNAIVSLSQKQWEHILAGDYRTEG